MLYYKTSETPLHVTPQSRAVCCETLKAFPARDTLSRVGFKNAWGPIVDMMARLELISRPPISFPETTSSAEIR